MGAWRAALYRGPVLIGVLLALHVLVAAWYFTGRYPIGPPDRGAHGTVTVANCFISHEGRQSQYVYGDCIGAFRSDDGRLVIDEVLVRVNWNDGVPDKEPETLEAWATGPEADDVRSRLDVDTEFDIWRWFFLVPGSISASILVAVLVSMLNEPERRPVRRRPRGRRTARRRRRRGVRRRAGVR